MTLPGRKPQPRTEWRAEVTWTVERLKPVHASILANPQHVPGRCFICEILARLEPLLEERPSFQMEGFE